MKNILKILVIIVGAALIFLSGITIGIIGGAYYHTEIKVLWRGFFPEQAKEAIDQQPTEKNNPKTQSVIRLPNAGGEQLPLVYSDTLEEGKIQEYLKEGAVVLPLGVAFGEPGNVVVTAHSSGTAAFGPFRFAFAKLSELEVGNEFTVTTPTATYRYRVYKKEIVWPHQVDKLPQDDRSTVTLVTCWPLWTNFKRLLVHAELVGTEYEL